MDITKVCIDCKEEKSIEQFPKNGKYRKSYCKSCRNIRDKTTPSYETRVKDSVKSLVKFKNKGARFLKLTKIIKGCLVCGIKEYECLDFHHVNPDSKEYNPSSLAGKPVQKIKEELRKCVVLCANHHRLVHAGKIDLSIFKNKI